jgi:VWFA-related protein
LLAVVVVAQEQPPRPTFRTEANYVRVDVFPTRNGTPVLDLTKDDFELRDAGAPQTIEQFEHVVIRGNIPQELRKEPNTVAESREALRNPRARVFVVFLDIGHVEVEGSWRVRQPLINALNKLIGEDDLVAIMTPDMSPEQLAFGRKTTVIEGFLTRQWTWGERGQLLLKDPVEQQYQTCFQTDVLNKMIARHREKTTLDALERLVFYLRTAREERKAVITITDGWRLFGLDRDLMDAGGRSGAAPPTIGIDPGGRLRSGDSVVAGTVPQDVCNRDRVMLAMVDHPNRFRQILDEANAANTAFYPLDPRGLAVFDNDPVPISKSEGLTPMPTNIGGGLQADSAVLHARLESLYSLAAATDGIALVNNNDLTASFKRIVDDLSSYYLLGYYSTTKLDGKFHSVSVRVKRPGVDVRARRGYLAATPNSMGAAAATAAAAAVPKVDPEAAAVTAAMAPLAGFTREVPLRVQAATGWRGGDAPTAFVVVEGELSGAREYEETWRSGATATIELATNDGPSLASARVTVAAGTRTFRATLTPTSALAPGDYVVRTSARGGDAIPLRDTLRVAVVASPQANGAIWYRRSPATVNREVPTADVRYRRNEQAIVEVPAASASAVTARLLDRSGKPLTVPVTATVREDADGTRWGRAQVVLAPLGAGDYVIELSEGSTRTLAAFRLVP